MVKTYRRGQGPEEAANLHCNYVCLNTCVPATHPCNCRCCSLGGGGGVHLGANWLRWATTDTISTNVDRAYILLSYLVLLVFFVAHSWDNILPTAVVFRELLFLCLCSAPASYYHDVVSSSSRCLLVHVVTPYIRTSVGLVLVFSRQLFVRPGSWRPRPGSWRPSALSGSLVRLD